MGNNLCCVGKPAAPTTASIKPATALQTRPAFNSAQPVAPAASSNLIGSKNPKELSMVFSQASQSQIDKGQKGITVRTIQKDLTSKDRAMLGVAERDQIRAFNVEKSPTDPEYLIKDSNYFDESEEDVVRSKFNVNKSSTDLKLASYHIGSTKAIGTGQIKSFMFDREVQVL